jgi:hypothetical protein
MSTSLEGSIGSLEMSLFQGLSAGKIRRVTLEVGASSGLLASAVVDDLQLAARKMTATTSVRSRNERPMDGTN